MNQESKRPITVEDLIRLKRAERPPREFWDLFDRELRTKQLAALVGKRSWWVRGPELFARLVRHRLSLGTAAILAVTFVTVREYRLTPSPAANDSAVRIGTTTAVPGAVAGGAAATVGEEPPGVFGAYQVRDLIPVAPVEEARNAPPPATGGLSHMVSLLGGGAVDARTTDLIAANLAAAQAAEPTVARSLLGTTRGSETRVMPVRAPAVEPLAQMTPPCEARRVRIQSAIAMMTSLDAPARTGVRVSSQISDERLYDQTHRLSGRGDRLSFKF